MQVIIIEFLGKFTSTVRLDWKKWLISTLIAFIRSVTISPDAINDNVDDI